jgi:hypothetical protein
MQEANGQLEPIQDQWPEDGESDAAPQPIAIPASEHEAPLTAEMIDSLARLRARLQEILFAPSVSTRSHWSLLPPGN